MNDRAVGDSLADPETRDRPFNAHRIPLTEQAKLCCSTSVDLIDTLEAAERLRQRRRRSSAQRKLEVTVAAIISDVAVRYLRDGPLWLAIPMSKRVLSKKTRYSSEALGEHLPDTVEKLAHDLVNLLELRKGSRAGPDGARQSTIRATPKLCQYIDQLGLRPNDFGTSAEKELIILKDVREGKSAKAVDYKDTDTTRRYRQQIREINAWLAQADFSVDPKGIAFDPMRPAYRQDASVRTLRRVFNDGSFRCGGRLFGGFWQPMSKQERADAIRIEGRRTVALDFSQMNPSLMYARAGLPAPEADAYVITCREDLGASRGLRRVVLAGIGMRRENYRRAGKLMFNAMAYSRGPLTRLPAGMRTACKLPRTVSLEDFAQAMQEFHAPIAEQFQKGEGLRAMFDESEVLVRTLLSLKEQGIVALPIHDALVVREDCKEAVRLTMMGAYRAYTGQEVTVMEEGFGPDSPHSDSDDRGTNTGDAEDWE